MTTPLRPGRFYTDAEISRHQALLHAERSAHRRRLAALLAERRIWLHATIAGWLLALFAAGGCWWWQQEQQAQQPQRCAQENAAQVGP